MKWLYNASGRTTTSVPRGSFDECVVMSWCIGGSSMTKISASKVSKIVSERVAPIAREVESLKQNFGAAPQSKASGFWTKPWVVNLGSAIVGGLVVLAATMLIAHSNSDSKRDISDEVSRQLGGEATRNQITAEISRQLVPMNQQLNQLSEDIGKIKDSLHIAKAEPLPKIDEHVRALEASANPEPAEVIAIAKSLRISDQRAPGYWPVVARLSTLEARARAHEIVSPQTAKLRPSCIHVSGKIRGLTVDQGGDYDCAVNLDDISVTDATISNALVFFSGRVSLSNVRFVNCIFVTSLPSAPPEPAKRLAEEILASIANQVSSFTITTG